MKKSYKQDKLIFKTKIEFGFDLFLLLTALGFFIYLFIYHVFLKPDITFDKSLILFKFYEVLIFFYPLLLRIKRIIIYEDKIVINYLLRKNKIFSNKDIKEIEMRFHDMTFDYIIVVNTKNINTSLQSRVNIMIGNKFDLSEEAAIELFKKLTGHYDLAFHLPKETCKKLYKKVGNKDIKIRCF